MTKLNKSNKLGNKALIKEKYFLKSFCYSSDFNLSYEIKKYLF